MDTTSVRINLITAYAILAAVFWGLWWVSGRLVRAAEKVLITPAGIKWDCIVVVIYIAVSLRYGAALVLQHDAASHQTALMSLLKLIMLGMGCAFTAMGGNMAHAVRVRLTNEAAVAASEAAQKGGRAPRPLNWREDIARYQVPLVLVALGLTLFQMVG